jgi:spermidine synthase
MVLLFASTLFLSSALLFLVQPMIAKMVLPMLGGTPAVWNTCMVFFQTTLLFGYLYVHASTRWLAPRKQALLHIALLAVAFAGLPIAVASYQDPPTTGTPIVWLLRLLILTVGIPFFVVSTSGPLLQRWFARTNHVSARDPYFLSVAGNLGSIVALLAYPALLEPSLRLATQSSVWAAGYGVFVVLTTFCYWRVYRSTCDRHQISGSTPPNSDEQTPERPGWVRQLHWIALAAVPSSLLLGVTTYLTTDVAAVPLFWIVPLAGYLLTFALVFAKRTLLPHALMVRALPLMVLPLASLIVFDSKLPAAFQSPVHLVTFFLAAMVCHGELARLRPDERYLTEFYLCMSIGGVIGGCFNALIAPLLFPAVLEYPLALVFACALRPRADQRSVRRACWLDFTIPAGFGLAVLGMMFAFKGAGSGAPLHLLLVYIAPALVCFSFKRRPVRFALSLGALMLASGAYMSANEGVIHRGRSFFGVHRILYKADSNTRSLVHGGIIHGIQSLDPRRRHEPSTYFHRTGPIGQAFSAFHGDYAKRRVAVVGLGVGTLAAYSEPEQEWTFYEIDPEIASLASDPHYFTFLSDSRAPMRIVLGDARISLTKERPRSFDLLIVDAFSSDAIPVHLLTSEALKLYEEKLDVRGVLAFHISNRYLDFAPLLASLAHEAGLICLVQDDLRLDAGDKASNKSASRWAIMARSADDLGALARDRRWLTPSTRSTQVPWTDDFSNPLGLFRWFRR